MRRGYRSVRLLLCAVLIAAVAAAVPTAAGAPQGARPLADIVVTPRWLADRLSKEPIVILHLGDQAGYDAGHIPGAQLMTLAEISDPASAPLRLQMASVDRLRSAFEAHGVTDATRVVLYFGTNAATPTARVFVALDYLGLADRVSILDGGLPAWKAAGQPVSADKPIVTAGRFTPHVRPEVIVNADWVQAHLTDSSVTILDARTADYYTGENTNGFPRPGHIAGAASLPYGSFGDATTFVLKDIATLRQLFETAGAKPGAEVVSYCHIGQQASQVYVVGRLLGYRVHLYDGSFEEWSAKPDLPVEKGAGKIIK